MHCTNQVIKQTIPYSKGLEKLADYKFDEHEMCPACMIGKSKLQNVPGLAKRATRPLAKVNFDLIVSTIPSIEGYLYGALFVSSICPWVYAGENLFPSAPSKSFPRCTLTDVCKGGGYGFNVGALLQGWRLWFQCRRVVARVETMVSMTAYCSKG
jgi:hypothetical protein